MKIKSIIDLADHFDTSVLSLDSTLSNKAHRDIHVDKLPSCVRIGTFMGECNAEFCIVCSYPFESSAVDVFIDTIEHTCTAAYDEAFDDPVEMLMNMTEPFENWTVDDAQHIMSEAEAQGWHIDPQLTPEDILAIYNDLNNEEEDD